MVNMFCIIVGTVFMTAIPNIRASNILEENSNNFGPYTCSWTEFDLCQGPKARNLSTVSSNLVKEGDDFIGHLNMTFLTQARVEEIRILVYVLKGNTKNILWSYNLKDPCQHYVFANIIEKNLNAHNCVVSKGSYECVTNYSEMITMLLGPSFFYGQYVMKATVLSKKGNILCIITNLKFQKNLKKTNKDIVIMR